MKEADDLLKAWDEMEAKLLAGMERDMLAHEREVKLKKIMKNINGKLR